MAIFLFNQGDPSIAMRFRGAKNLDSENQMVLASAVVIGWINLQSPRGANFFRE
jgi:hypothetical protein